MEQTNNVLVGYVVPGCKDELKIQESIADFLAYMIAETNGACCVLVDTVGRG